MIKLICPNCGVATSFSPASIIGNGILLDESSEKYTKRGNVQISAITPYFYEEDTYAILICQACNEYFVVRRGKYNRKESDDWSAVYPIQHKPAAQEIPEPIKSEFEEAQICFALDAYRGCLLVCRTALIALQREQNASNLNELKEKGIISRHLCEQSDEIRLWANMIGHEDIPETISREDCEQLLTYLEALLNTIYVEPKHLTKLTQKRNELKAKQQT